MLKPLCCYLAMFLLYTYLLCKLGKLGEVPGGRGSKRLRDFENWYSRPSGSLVLPGAQGSTGEAGGG